MGANTNAIGTLRGAAAVTPSDTTPLPADTRALYVGTAGSLVLQMADGSTVSITNASGWMPIAPALVKAASGASDITAWW